MEANGGGRWPVAAETGRGERSTGSRGEEHGVTGSRVGGIHV